LEFVVRTAIDSWSLSMALLKADNRCSLWKRI